MQLHDIPGMHESLVFIPAVGSGESTTEFPLFVAPFDATIKTVQLSFGSAAVGDATNRFNFNLIYKGTGSGSAEIANLDLAAGTTATAFAPYSLFSGTQDISESEVVSLQYEKVSGGFNVAPVVVRVRFVGA
jgi:hypothetical protein